jgi:hypothetical protein
MLIVFSGCSSKDFFTRIGFFIWDFPSNPPIISMSGSLPAYSFFFIVSLTGDHESLEINSFPFCYLNIEISVSIRALTFEFFNSNSTISQGFSTNLPHFLSYIIPSISFFLSSATFIRAKCIL